MDNSYEWRYAPYSWHQSHDQATVLLMVPSDTTEEDMSVIIQRNYLIAGVRGQPPIVKGRLYGNIDSTNSVWQLEPRTSRLSHRSRTTSTTSTASTQSSYAIVSDPEISSSFAASLESGQVSDAEDLSSPSPALSSPSLSSADEARGFPFQQRTPRSNAASRPVSPGRNTVTAFPLPNTGTLRSMPSSFSSLESLGTGNESGRLVTLHLEKEQSVIWPSLIVGPVPESLAPYMYNSVIFDASHELEHRYNMDPTSLTLTALELFDIRKDKEEAFECFLRAWHLAHAPTATMKLVTYYLPIHVSYNLSDFQTRVQADRGTTTYYLQCIGGPHGLARLYLEAGMLYLEGTATNLVACSHSSLSSIRMPLPTHLNEGLGTGTEVWRRNQIAASRFFDRAKALQSDLEIPTLPAMEVESAEELEMPAIELNSGGVVSGAGTETLRRRRRRDTEKRNESGMLNNTPAKVQDGMDNAWYMLNLVPGLVGAGTALVVVGVVGVLSFSSWSRRNQGS